MTAFRRLPIGWGSIEATSACALVAVLQSLDVSGRQVFEDSIAVYWRRASALAGVACRAYRGQAQGKRWERISHHALPSAPIKRSRLNRKGRYLAGLMFWLTRNRLPGS